jgi:hypothetical protein
MDRESVWSCYPNSIAQCDSGLQQQLLTAQQAYAAQSSSSSSPSGLSRHGKIALGVALGLGVPFLVLAGVLLYLQCCRPVKKQQQTVRAESSKQSAVVTGADSEHSVQHSVVELSSAV